MAYDEGLAQVLRGDLEGVDGISEKRMFGGLAFMHYGNMLCGVTPSTADVSGMFRVGKDREAEALALPGVQPLSFTGRKMGGMVEMTHEGFAEDDARDKVLALALAFAQTLPPK